MSHLYPLRLRPVFRRYLWGGRKLETLLGKSLEPGEDYAESWEVCDHDHDQSTVAAGPLAGTTLHELVTRAGRELLGKHHPQKQFPLLLKFLDAQKALSVQVHPDDAMAATLEPPDLGKTEAWIILAAEPGSVIYAGLKSGVNRTVLQQAIADGTCEQHLHRIMPKPGDCFFLPAGVVHAIGAGLVVAEIQQASDTTFRLFDWNRVGPDGKPRQLQIDQGLAATDFDFGPVTQQTPAKTPPPHAHAERLVQCDKFILDRWKIDSPQDFHCDGRCHILSVLEGELSIAEDVVDEPARIAQTWLIPAAVETLRLLPSKASVLLDAYLP